MDGHNIASNGQGSTVGDGWDINIPYIERQYLACKFDRPNDKTGDLCWQSPYASKPEEAAYVINLNGQTANLIWDGADHGPNVVGYLVDGVPNWRVSRISTPGNSTRNGDNDAEYFKVETPDGSVYYFGYGELPGPGNYKTNSAAVVPVFGDDVGEPCFGASPCTQAYRWMLDLSVDTNQIAQSYKYTKVDNMYAVSGVTTDSQVYTAEILPSMITYGRTFTDLTHALGLIGASITFQTRQRCIEDASLNDYLGQPTSGCPTIDLAHVLSYPDVPVDLICTTAPCTSAQSSPAFFHRYRLAGIETISGHPTTAPVSLTSQTVLVANFPPVSDGGTRSLWLDSVYTKYTGVDASTATTYRTEFIGTEMRNRVDPGIQDSDLMRRRIVRILTDSGSAIDVDYSSNRPTKTCPNDPTPPSTTLNVPALAMDCYQVMLTEIDGTPKYGTFNKYLVHTVTVRDLVGGQPAMETKYDYLGDPGWGYGNDLLRADGQSDQTWSSWRGYGRVTVSTLAPVPGADPEAPVPVVSTTTKTYFRGLDTDFTTATDARGRVATLSFTPPGSTTPDIVPDSPNLQGMLFASETKDAAGALVSQSREKYITQGWLPSAVSFPQQPQYAAGDFNGDGTDDLFRVAAGGQWQYSPGGVGECISLRIEPTVPLKDLRFGDFNADGATDVFTANSAGQWLLSYSATSNWTVINSSGIPFSDLRFGDFNGDGYTDVFSINGTQWQFSSAGTSGWVPIATASAAIDTLRFGDFNGDHKTDVFVGVGSSQWYYSSAGASNWMPLGTVSRPETELRFEDVTGDGKTDVMSNSASGQWQISTGGSSPWTALNGSPNLPMSQLVLGNFDGDSGKHSDVLFPRNGKWYTVTGAQIAAKLDPATSATTDVSGAEFPGLLSRPNPAAMDGVVVLPSGSESWSYAPGTVDPDAFYSSSQSSTTYNTDALPTEEASVATGGGKSVTTRTTTDYVWGYGGATAVHTNPGHLNGFGTAKHIVLPWESTTYSNSSDDTLGEVMTGHVKVLYDGKTTDATNVPTSGLPTTEMTLGTGNVWRTAKATYDTQGRILTAQDPGDVAVANGRQTSWIYTVPTDQKSMDVKVTSPDGVVNHTWYDFRTGGPTKAVTTQPTEAEAAGQWTHYRYNAAGMLVAGWGPLQSSQLADPSTDPAATVPPTVPTVSYAYDIFTNVPALRTTPTVVTTMSLAGPNGSGGWVMANQAGTVRRSYQYLDGLLRPVETHSVAQDLVSGDHLVSATRYDALGQVAWATGPFVVDGAAQADNPLANPVPGTLDQVTYNLRDSSWRPTGSAVTSHGTTISASSTSTVGLTTTATDPTGLRTIAVSDVAGRLVSQKQVPVGGTESTTPPTTYAYTRLANGGLETSVTDTELHVTTLVTDFEGRKVSLDDPNSGYTSYAYDPNFSSRVTSISAGADGASLTDVTSMTYDTPGRLTDRTSTVGGVASSSAHWTYGTGAAFSHVLSDTATTVVDGASYVLAHGYAYDAMHRPTTVTTTLPVSSSLGDLSGRVTATTAHYDAVTGVQSSTDFATAIGGLPAETVTTGFDRLGRGVSLTVGANNFQLVKGVTWDATGLLTSRTYGDDAVRSLQYDLGTRAVSRMIAGVVGGTTFQDDLYVRSGDTGNGTDPGTVGDGTVDGLSTGTLTSITDAAIPASPVSQCYAYTGLNRLASAWTIAGSGSACASSFAGNSASLDTADTKYATAWNYSTAGRVTSVSDLLAGTSRAYDPDRVDPTNPAAVKTTTNPDLPEIPAVPAVPPSEEHPDGIPEVPAVAAVPVAADTFTYDALGRMIGRVTHEVDPVARTVTAHTLELTWDASSNLVKTDLDGAQVVYLYDSSGQRVAQIGITAATATAYLGATEVTDPNTAVNADLVVDPTALEGSAFVTGTRYYTLGGATVAVREAPTAASPTDKLSFLFGDVQGSAQVIFTHTIDANGALNDIADAVVSRNAYTPYGTTRGEGSSAANDSLSIDHGWLNQVSDEASTGLVYLNARYYDPAVARFASPDPQMNPSDPKTLDPYRYAENNPITYTDATGLCSTTGSWAYVGGVLEPPCNSDNGHDKNGKLYKPKPPRQPDWNHGDTGWQGTRGLNRHAPADPSVLNRLASVGVHMDDNGGTACETQKCMDTGANYYTPGANEYGASRDHSADGPPVSAAETLIGMGLLVLLVGVLTDGMALPAILGGGVGVTAEDELGTAAGSPAAEGMAAAGRASLAQRLGFSGSGPRIIVDENLPSSWAAGLREAGYDARSVSEMNLRGATDAQLNQFAGQVNARVLTRDVGHDVAGGFGGNGVVLDSRVTSLQTALRILGGAG